MNDQSYDKPRQDETPAVDIINVSYFYFVTLTCHDELAQHIDANILDHQKLEHTCHIGISLYLVSGENIVS